MNESKSLFKSQEKKSNSWNMYPFNSYSSLFYLVLLNKLCNKELNFINIYGIIISILLTISSFFWWARRNKNVQLIDINSYSLLIFFVGIYFLHKNYESSNKNLEKYLLLITTSLVLITSLVNKEKIRYLNILGVVFSISILLYFIKTKIEYLGIFLLFLSIILKLFDTFEIIDFNKYRLISGTGWFHILSALGIYCIL